MIMEGAYGSRGFPKDDRIFIGTHPELMEGNPYNKSIDTPKMWILAERVPGNGTWNILITALADITLEIRRINRMLYDLLYPRPHGYEFFF